MKKLAKTQEMLELSDRLMKKYAEDDTFEDEPAPVSQRSLPVDQRKPISESYDDPEVRRMGRDFRNLDGRTSRLDSLYRTKELIPTYIRWPSDRRALEAVIDGLIEEEKKNPTPVGPTENFKE